jgi:ABC-2 type transport system ATP-binding protein
MLKQDYIQPPRAVHNGIPDPLVTGITNQSAAESALTVANLVKRYPKGKSNAVDDVSFAVRRGEIFGLLGPNGAGKTTTIGVLTTAIRPTSGAATIAGVDVAKDPIGVKQRIAVVPQQSNLDRSLKVREILTFHAAYHGVGRRERDQLADSLLDQLGLGARKNDKVSQYSGGMVQRLMIARALMHEPEVLFLDEPTNNLDPQSRLFLWEKIRELHARGLTILLTTHDMEEADQLCDRIAVMDHGKILVNDSPEALKRTLPGSSALELQTFTSSTEHAEINQRIATVLGSLPGTAKVDTTTDGPDPQEPGHYTHKLFGDNVHSLIGSAAQAIAEAGAEVRNVSVKKPSLEEVFLSLTGRHLR